MVNSITQTLIILVVFNTFFSNLVQSMRGNVVNFYLLNTQYYSKYTRTLIKIKNQNIIKLSPLFEDILSII